MKLLLVILTLVPASAQAYLDPSTGSMVISAIVGLFASVVLAVRTYWFRIRSFFGRGGQSVDSAPEDPGK